MTIRSIHAVLFAIFLTLFSIGLNTISSGMGPIIAVLFLLALVIGVMSFFLT